MKFACVCQSGLGTSFMVQMNIQSILEEAGVNIDDFELEHMDVGSATSDAADYFFVESTLVSALPNIPEEKIIPLNSIIDKEIAREGVYKVLDENGIEHQ
ncbi:PTS sugar transporter subunit IIB [Lactococcus allomyrinae]|uniref:PTS sugar transporter subunit IIB n=1 Tax=Lactococcus allomyrinae TaxID=2419773 RepID=A0A387BQA5_9LACT|nr:PTS sugar transporter subunit IIB [Lactococcus allomyrinae]AYG00681.1 PTS sugar transporter subunit IIB [Lactococcus allomyrinae]